MVDATSKEIWCKFDQDRVSWPDLFIAVIETIFSNGAKQFIIASDQAEEGRCGLIEGVDCLHPASGQRKRRVRGIGGREIHGGYEPPSSGEPVYFAFVERGTPAHNQWRSGGVGLLESSLRRSSGRGQLG